jgi:hypothetical protein
MMRNRLLWCLILCTFSCKLGAQDTLSFFAMAKVHPDSLVLRWAPKSNQTWQHAMKHGFKLERCEYPVQLDVELVFQTIDNNISFKPQAYWQQRFKPSDSLAMIAAQLLFGTSKNPDLSTESGISDAGAIAENNFLFTMMAADRS